MRFHKCKSTILCWPEQLRLHDLEVKERVHFVGDSHRFKDGDMLNHGSIGKVISSASGRRDLQGYLCVKFAHLRENVEILFKYLSRTAPEALPDGFEVQRRVFFIGARTTLKYGSSGVVVGAARGREARVRFQEGVVSCCPSELSSTAPEPSCPSFKAPPSSLLPSSASSPSPEPEELSGDEPWSCSRCTFLHEGLVALRKSCRMCEQPKVSSGSGSSSSSSSSALRPSPTSSEQEALAAALAKAQRARMVAKRVWKAAKAKEADLAAEQGDRFCSVYLARSEPGEGHQVETESEGCCSRSMRSRVRLRRVPFRNPEVGLSRMSCLSLPNIIPLADFPQLTFFRLCTVW